MNISLNKFLFISLVLISSLGFSQNKNTQEADDLFDNYQYVEAIDEYLKLVKNRKANDYVYKKLGDSYYKIFNMVEASKWYAEAIKKKQDAETYYRYAQTLKSQGKYEEANEQLTKFAKMKPEDSRAIAHMKNPNYIPQLANNDKLFTVESVTASSKEFADFAPVKVGNTLYFTSNRNTGNKNDKWVDQPYLDIYEVNLNQTNAEPQPIKNLNTNYHDGPVTISKDGNLMVFSKQGHEEGLFKKGKGRTKITQNGLYLAKKVNGEWEYVKPLPFNSSEYSVTHPALSDDGKTLYFASNMPGGLGDTDLWKVDFSETKVGKPVNLGEKINTPAKEGFPSVSGNVLYFSTNGRQGFGGYDIFKIALDGDNEAKNLGSPVNTEKDDFSFSKNKDDKNAYFASNRDGIDNLYLAVAVCNLELMVTVKDAETSQLIANAKVSILDEMGNKIATEKVNDKGQVNFNLKCGNSYQLEVGQGKYETKMQAVAEAQDGLKKQEVLLEPIKVEITETEVKLDNIYFEFDESFITKQGALELDKLVSVMKSNPEMNIQIKSHTDSKGSAAYNLKLSNERAQSTMQYVISKGISKDRLTAKGMGSTDPKIDCMPNCTDDEDAQNRRSEFIIVKK